MNVEELMTRGAETCSTHDSLARAAQIMWERDCGCVPVLDHQRRLMGMLTDRDLCMAAYTQGRPLQEISAAQVMTQNLKTASPSDSIEAIETLMQVHQLRRLPVVAADGALVGMITLSDLAREADRQRNPKIKELRIRQVEATFAAVCRPRNVPVPLSLASIA